MLLFKTYFRLVYRRKTIILIYILVFIGIAGGMTVMAELGGDETTTDAKYTPQSVDIAVIDRDQSALSNNLKEYLGEKNVLVTLADNQKSIQDALYWRNVEYVLVIPKHFSEKVEQGEAVELDSRKIQDSVNATYVDEEVNAFLRLLSVYQSAGYGVDEAVVQVRKDIGKQVSVQLVKNAQGEQEKTSGNTGYQYFLYLPYVFLAVGIIAISAILILFYQEDVRSRCRCSALSLREQNTQLILASVLFCLGIAVLFILFGVALYRGSLFRESTIGFYSINAFVFMLVVIALSYLLANLISSETAINACSNVFSLGFCFLGGIFVPLSVMPKQIVALAHFIPSYWYVQANEDVAYLTQIDADFLKRFFANVGMELAFAGAYLCIAILASRRRTENCL